jgi:hypothetical protein
MSINSSPEVNGMKFGTAKYTNNWTNFVLKSNTLRNVSEESTVSTLMVEVQPAASWALCLLFACCFFGLTSSPRHGARSFEMSVNFYQTKRHHIPDCTFHNHHRENLQSQITSFWFV